MELKKKRKGNSDLLDLWRWACLECRDDDLCFFERSGEESELDEEESEVELDELLDEEDAEDDEDEEDERDEEPEDDDDDELDGDRLRCDFFLVDDFLSLERSRRWRRLGDSDAFLDERSRWE